MRMSVAAAARVGAYTVACLIAVALALAAHGRAVPVGATWRDALQHAEAALAGGDVREAQQSCQEAHRAVMGARSPEGMLDVGEACLRIGAAASDRWAAVAQARRIYLVALFQARERGDSEAVARAGEAFATLGDREVADRAFELAMALATQSRDAAARDHVAALRARTDDAVRASARGVRPQASRPPSP
jgi:hypothetical protein